MYSFASLSATKNQWAALAPSEFLRGELLIPLIMNIYRDNEETLVWC